MRPCGTANRRCSWARRRRRSAPGRWRWRTTSFFNIPNLISLSRVPMAAAFVWIPNTTVRVVLLAAAAASDWLDGWWARTRGPATPAGAVLDPATDKIFLVSALAGFVVNDVITPLELGVLLARDVFVTAGALAVLALRIPVRLRARFPGKLLTNVQIAAVLVLLLLPRLAPAVVIAVGVVTIWAIVDYAAEGVRSLRRPAGDG